MKVVHKYPVAWGVALALPRDAKIVHVAMQQEQLHLWVEIDLNAPTVQRKFYVLGTGHPMRNDLIHRGTALDGKHVWHIYEDV